MGSPVNTVTSSTATVEGSPDPAGKTLKTLTEAIDSKIPL